MMKKIIIILMLLSTLLFATEQSNVITAKIAKNFLKTKNSSYSISNNFEVYTNKQVVAEVYNLEPTGFVFVSKDNDLPPVLAYSFKNNLNKKNIQENEFFQMAKEDINLRTQYYRINKTNVEKNHDKWEDLLNNPTIERDFQQWPVQNTTSTDGWIETTWNQTGSFNKFCPKDNSNQRSVVGCVATAFSQLLNFHKSIGNISMNNSDRYTCGDDYPYIHIDQDHESRDFPDFPTLNVYLDSLKYHYENNVSLTNNDKAALCFMAGITVQMNYSSGGSGAWTQQIINVLLNRMGYTSAQWVDYNGNSTLQLMAEDAKHMRPNEFSIRHADGSAGHAINCDGYNTNDYYHLNFGWGTSNTTCWYTLPQGMPSGYSVISGVGVNIQGGITPISLTGTVNCDISPVGAHVLISGEKTFEAYVTDTDGSFSVPALVPGDYTVTTTLGRVYYSSFETTIDENNNTLNINLGNFEALTGNITSANSTIQANVALYQDGEIVYSGLSNEDGSYSIPDVLPGDYFATISSNGNEYVSKNMTVTLEDQEEDFTLNSYPGNLMMSHANSSAGFCDMNINIPLTIAVKYSADDFENEGNELFAKFRFKSPINSSDGTLYAQVWKNNELFFEKQLSDYSEGEWIDVNLDNYMEINQDTDYYFGYKLIADGHIACVDNGPIMENKGAFVRTTSWINYTSLNKNFCIQPIAISDNFGTISGNVSISGENVNFADAIVRAGNYAAQIDSNGNYSLNVKPGVYDIVAYYQDHQSQIIPNIQIENGETENNYDLVINMAGNNDHHNDIQKKTELYSNYPNPFYNSANTRGNGTTISYSLKNKSKVSLNIYNILGQKIKTLVNSEQKSGNHKIVWNGKDNNNRKVSSGIYFYRLENEGKSLTKKMLILK